MSEFLDFLKHKYAYVAIGEFKPGRFDEAKRLFVSAVSTYQDGFQGAYLLQQPGTDCGVAVILWDSVDAMEANRTEAHEAILKQMGHLFAFPPKTNLYEVCSEIKPEEKG